LAADLAIQIPGNLNQDGIYRLDYFPPHGVPSPNTTIASRDIGDVIEFSQGLPGTKYEFWLYYSNNTRRDWLTWTASITTGEFRDNARLGVLLPRYEFRF
jgi:cadherin 5 type 2 (VE-cadherin)